MCVCVCVCVCVYVFNPTTDCNPSVLMSGGTFSHGSNLLDAKYISSSHII